MSDTESAITFGDLGLSTPLLDALSDVGYETPSPIQAGAIPALLEGRDILGQAQTGTGKTAAFALPLLQRVDTSELHPQVLVLAPTRELAIQVAEACEKYSKHLSGLRTLSIYGGQGYDTQLRALRKGVQVIIGTPGRVMDHVRRGTLSLDKLQCLVLDEADEMLRMGFIDDVEWILQHTPPTRQIALFSATMPREIKTITERYLQNPVHVKIKSKTETASTIRQRVWEVRGLSKLQALTRLLEMHEHDAALIFVRTKTATEELAEQLNQSGFQAAALNGDIPQAQRERVVNRLKSGKLDVMVATDVVARGLDVERISHVINFDIPYDVESYVHRIGRTGRAGRQGDAVLFVTNRERRLLQQIERHTRSPIEKLELPDAKALNKLRSNRLKEQLVGAIDGSQTADFHALVSELSTESGITPSALAAAALQLIYKNKPFYLNENEPTYKERPQRERSERPDRGDRKSRRDAGADEGKTRYWIGVGHQQGVKPGNIVGAIANEANISSALIGRISISENFATIDLPNDISHAQLKKIGDARVCGKQLSIRPWQDEMAGKPARRKAPPRDKNAKPRAPRKPRAEKA